MTLFIKAYMSSWEVWGLDDTRSDVNAMLKEISDCSFLDKGIVGAKAKS